MSLPFVIDNLSHRLADMLSELLKQSVGRPLDIATAYFSISGYKLVKDGLDTLGSFRLLLGTDPQSGADVGLKVDPNALKARIKGDLEAEPFTPATLKLVEDLVAYLRADKVEVRLYDEGAVAPRGQRERQDDRPGDYRDAGRPLILDVGRHLHVLHHSACPGVAQPRLSHR